MMHIQPGLGALRQQPGACCPASRLPVARGLPPRLGRRSTTSSSRLVPRTASLEAPTAAPPPADRSVPSQNGQHNNQQQQQQQQQPQAAPADAKGFCWTKAWWPVIPLHYLDPKKPMPVTMLGHTYVVWFEPKAQQWRVMEDRCPHRLAPLSEGRIDADGTLMCSYHGWQFNGAGGCTRIPQIRDPEREKAACASPRACVASFPTTVVEGMLFAWLESGPEAEQEAAAQQPYVMPEQLGSGVQWAMSELPVDYTFWLEQGMDPTHANFLHHTCGFPMKDALPMPGNMVSPNNITLQDGYTWEHGNYTYKASGMQAVRQFVPPNTLRVVYDRGFVRGFSTMGTPVRPGMSRVFGRFSFGSFKPAADGKKTLMQQLMTKLPHWVFIRNTLPDQDTVVNVKQEAYMRSLGLTPKDYASFARADQGVLAAHKWFDMAGYEQMWQQRLGDKGDSKGASSSGGGVGARYAYQDYVTPTEPLIFDWYERHTKHCPQCQQGMQLMQAAANAAAVAGVLLAVLAASLAVAAKTLAAPGVVVAALLAGGCAWAREKLLEFRHTQFISSKYKWQKDGGLSLVKGDPVKVQLATE